MKPVIVGLDPGTTSAFAIIDFDFNIIKIKSKKDYSLAGIIYDVYKEGYPLIIATDKKEIPSFIKEFSQKTGSKIYNPKYDTKKGEKLFIVKEKRLIDFCKNTHEIDALASAIFAYKEYNSIIKKINNFLESNKRYETKKDKIKNFLFYKLIGEDKNLYFAVKEFEEIEKIKNINDRYVNDKKDIEKPIKEIENIFKNNFSKEEKEIFLLKRIVDKLKKEINLLKKENNILKNKKIDIDKEIKKIISFKEKRAISYYKENIILKEKIKNNNIEIEKLKNAIIKTNKNYLVKIIKNLTKEEYNLKKVFLNIEKDDLIYVEDLKNLSENVLNELKEKIKIIILEKDKILNKNILNILEKNFILIDINKLQHERISNDFIFVKKDEFDNYLNFELKEKNKSKILNEIIENYRYERAKELYNLNNKNKV